MVADAGRIRELYEIEEKAGRFATAPDDIPFNYTRLTPEWLTAHLCKDHPGALVTEFRLDEKDDGTSNRQRIWLTYNDAGRAAGLPASVFCKASQGLLNRINLALSGGTHAEVTFYHRIRPLLSLNIPRCLHAAYDPDSFNSIIVLEDIAPQVEFCNHATTMSQAEVIGQIELLARMHGQFFDNAEHTTKTTGLVTWPEFFYAVVSYGHEQATNNGFRAAESVIPPRLFKRYDEVWRATCFAVDQHKTLPATLLHGDCHLKQWFKGPAPGQMGVSDWQCATFGSWARDIAYVVATSSAIEDRRRWEKDILRHYLDCLAKAGGAAPGFEEAWLRYRQNMVSVLSWWTGTLTPTEDQPDMQPRETSLEFIKRITHAIDDIDGLDACR
jgi:hypothetical protein